MGPLIKRLNDDKKERELRRLLLDKQLADKEHLELQEQLRIKEEAIIRKNETKRRRLEESVKKL